MEDATLIPLEKYAAMRRESIHTVIKKTMRGELQTVVEEKEGRKITYIVTSETSAPRSEAKAPAQEPEEPVDYKAAYEALQKELQALKEKTEKGE